MALALVALGEGEEAVRQAQTAVELTPIESNIMEGYDWPAYLAEVYLRLENHDAALDQLELLLSNPGWVSTEWLKVDPLWDPLRSHPRFQALLEEYRDEVEY